MDKTSLIREMADLIDGHERAIRQHPSETGRVYEMGRDAFVKGQASAGESDWSLQMGLTLEDLSVITRYMLASSFISAWYHLDGNKAQRDKAANACATLVSGTGVKPQDAMQRYIQYERLWRDTMKSEGMAPGGGRLRTMIIAVVVIAVIAAIVLM